ncbi:MAG: tetratricopeptide repeat protein [Bacteroidaceae bacterium]|nr:tetratricopeptide repeat protein [Bacteroidaceae bacterium]MBR3625902.1 tetratricopeptide repeat protein [Bacteroidaceae bacterium]
MLNFQLVLLLAITLLTSCQSLEQLSIDYMQPARISFPDELKRVGIVNNVPENLPNLLARQFTDVPDTEADGLSRKTTYYNGTPALAIESLAQAIADEQYFEQVIICDSALRASDTQLRAGGLSLEEINQLCSDLGVDVLISLEALQMREVREVGYIPEFGVFGGQVAVNVRPTINLYLPGRDTPVTTVNASDSIYWDEVGGSYNNVRNRLISEQEMVKQASDFAGTVPVKSLLPHWTTTERTYFTNGNIKMRDGVVYAREGQWDKAAELWQQAYSSSKSAKKQCYAAYNLALAYEMQDNIEEAFKWITTALEKAATADKVHLTEAEDAYTSGRYPVRFMLSHAYYKELEKRHANIPLLKAQLNRFSE